MSPVGQALRLARTKSIDKAVRFLQSRNYLSDSASDIATFLKRHRDRHELDDTAIGDYIGEGDSQFKSELRANYIRLCVNSFRSMDFESGIRLFLTKGGFRLPGEAQKIERLVNTFAQCYHEDNEGEFSCADTVMVLAYSTIMLNTDLHNPHVKAKLRMKRTEWHSNNRGIDNGHDVSKELLDQIYTAIKADEIKLLTAQDGGKFLPPVRRGDLIDQSRIVDPRIHTHNFDPSWLTDRSSSNSAVVGKSTRVHPRQNPRALAKKGRHLFSSVFHHHPPDRGAASV
jgi:Sec7-like guanine-nucleotide exchange factor